VEHDIARRVSCNGGVCLGNIPFCALEYAFKDCCNLHIQHFQLRLHGRNIDKTKKRQSDRHLPFRFKYSCLENIEGALSDMENVTSENPIIISLNLMPNKNPLVLNFMEK
jgi:hypothetical protein